MIDEPENPKIQIPGEADGTAEDHAQFKIKIVEPEIYSVPAWANSPQIEILVSAINSEKDVVRNFRFELSYADDMPLDGYGIYKTVIMG